MFEEAGKIKTIIDYCSTVDRKTAVQEWQKPVTPEKDIVYCNHGKTQQEKDNADTRRGYEELHTGSKGSHTS
jgi:hypothetical protein